MIEIHGWISIALSTDGEGEDSIVDAIRPLLTLVNNIRSEQNVISIQPINGRYFVSITNSSNHKGIEFEEIMSFISYISSYYRGAYGIIYVRDDEDENDNRFVVYKLVRGKVLVENDYYLSPCNPVIED